MARKFVVVSTTPLTKLSSGGLLGIVLKEVQFAFVVQSTTRILFAVVPKGEVGAGVCRTVTVPVPLLLTRMFIE